MAKEAPKIVCTHGGSGRWLNTIATCSVSVHDDKERGRGLQLTVECEYCHAQFSGVLRESKPAPIFS
jgi:hypothetical protein